MVAFKMGKRINKLRIKRGFTQDALAKKLKVTRAVVSAWETGKAVPRCDKLKPLARILQCNVTDLL